MTVDEMFRLLPGDRVVMTAPDSTSQRHGLRVGMVGVVRGLTGTGQGARIDWPPEVYPGAVVLCTEYEAAP